MKIVKVSQPLVNYYYILVDTNRADSCTHMCRTLLHVADIYVQVKQVGTFVFNNDYAWVAPIRLGYEDTIERGCKCCEIDVLTSAASIDWLAV